jgi:hypothetical protein
MAVALGTAAKQCAGWLAWLAAASALVVARSHDVMVTHSALLNSPGPMSVELTFVWDRWKLAQSAYYPAVLP